MKAGLDDEQPFPAALTCLAVAPERKATEAVKLGGGLFETVCAVAELLN